MADFQNPIDHIDGCYVRCINIYIQCIDVDTEYVLRGEQSRDNLPKAFIQRNDEEKYMWKKL